MEKRNGEKKTFVFLAGNESEILAPNSGNENPTKIERLDSISNPLSENGSQVSKKSVTILPQLLPTNEDIKPPVLTVKSKVKGRENSKSVVSPSQVPNLQSPSESPTLKSASPTPSRISAAPSRNSAQARKLIERHKSSDSILSSSSLPPVNRRRHSSQDRMGRFSVKNSAVEAIKSEKTTTANVPISLPPRPKVCKSQIWDNSKFKYTRSFSGNCRVGV